MAYRWPLKPHEHPAYLVGLAQLGEGIVQRSILKLQQRRQLLGVKLVHALLDVMREHEGDKRLLLVGELGRCC